MRPLGSVIVAVVALVNWIVTGATSALMRVAGLYAPVSDWPCALRDRGREELRTQSETRKGATGPRLPVNRSLCLRDHVPPLSGRAQPERHFPMKQQASHSGAQRRYGQCGSHRTECSTPYGVNYSRPA